MKKIMIATAIALSFILTACQAPQQIESTASSNISNAKQTQLAAENKKIVIDFYEGVFLKHQVQEYSDRYIGQQYIQHNPHVPDGKAPFVNYFTQYFKENP